jgi:ankyrin repeat protein
MNKTKLWKLLYAATKDNDLATVKQCLSLNVDINGIDKFGQTALMRASSFNHAEIVSELIKAGATLDLQSVKEKTALFMAVYNQSMECLKLLIEAGANVNVIVKNTTALSLAAFRGDMEIVDLLLLAGADPTVQPATTFLMAAVEGKFDVMSRLLGWGVDINQRINEMTLIFLIIIIRKQINVDIFKLIKFMVDNGTDIEASISPAAPLTPLVMAAQEGYPDLVAYLFELGANLLVLKPFKPNMYKHVLTTLPYHDISSLPVSDDIMYLHMMAKRIDMPYTILRNTIIRPYMLKEFCQFVLRYNPQKAIDLKLVTFEELIMNNSLSQLKDAVMANKLDLTAVVNILAVKKCLYLASRDIPEEDIDMAAIRQNYNEQLSLSTNNNKKCLIM